MKPFSSSHAAACPLGLGDVNTDQLIPARFMQTPRSEGYGKFLLHDLRRDDAGAMRADFPLNDPRYGSAETLIAGRNFGCGSSREAAVYVLADSGFTCVIAPSFADIFASNAAKNGLLAAIVSEEDLESLLGNADVVAGRPIGVDLASQTISAGNLRISFDIRPDRKARILNGWDDLGLTRSHQAKIDAFVARDERERPWAGAPDTSRLGRANQG
jgi:3-isopropylmalate/(R)-2-methylmalate dehydratase small subunit